MAVTSPLARPAYGELPNIRPARPAWPGVIARMLAIVLPGQVVGNFAAYTGLIGSGVLRDRPELSMLMPVLGAAVAGVGIGLLLRPDPDHLLGYVLVGAVVAVTAPALLIGLAHLRAPGLAPTAPLSAYLRDALILIVVQTAAALPLWLVRSRGNAKTGNS